MKFIQYKDTGACDIEFSEEEIKTISINKKIHFSPEALNLFGNALGKIVMDWNTNFNEDLQKKLNDGFEEKLDLSKDDNSRE